MKLQLTALGVACTLGLGAGTAQAATAISTEVPATAPDARSPIIAGWTSQRVGDGSVKRFVVPTLDCRQGQRQAIGVGVGQQTDVNQPDIIAEVVMFCADREPAYLIEVFVDGAGAQSVVSAGDELRFEIAYDSASATTTATDVTNPGASLTMTGSAEPAALHFGAFPFAVGGVEQAVPDFGAVRLIKARSDGAPLSESDATRTRRVEDGQVKISVGGISARPGSAGSFRLRFENH